MNDADTITDLRIHVARLEEQVKASDKALTLAQLSSRAMATSVVSTIISLLAIAVAFWRH